MTSFRSPGFDVHCERLLNGWELSLHNIFVRNMFGAMNLRMQGHLMSMASHDSPRPESCDSQASVTIAFLQMRAGEESGARRLWEHFFPRLVGLARTTLANRPQRVADAEDAALSAFMSFCQQANDGAVEGELHRENLWNLLGVFTVRKATKQLRRERAAKRGGGQVLGEAAFALSEGEFGGNRLDELAAHIPAVEFDLHCEELLNGLEPELREVVVLKLFGHSTDEISTLLEWTIRKVQRKLELVRLKWERDSAD